MAPDRGSIGGPTSGGHQHLEGSSIAESKAPSSSKTKRILHGNLNPVASFVLTRAGSLLQKVERLVGSKGARWLSQHQQGAALGLVLLQEMLFSPEVEEEEECRSLLRHVMRISSRKYSCCHTEEKAYRSSELSTFTQTTRSHIKSHGSKAALCDACPTQARFAPLRRCALINKLIRR